MGLNFYRFDRIRDRVVNLSVVGLLITLFGRIVGNMSRLGTFSVLVGKMVRVLTFEGVGVTLRVLGMMRMLVLVVALINRLVSAAFRSMRVFAL